MLQCLQIPAIPSKIRTIYAAIVGLEIISVRAGCTCKKHDGKICGKHGNCMDKELCAWTLQKTVANWGVMHSGNSVLPQENQMTPVYHLPFFLHFVWTVSDWISEYLLQYRDNKMTLSTQSRSGSPWGAFDPSVFWYGGTDTFCVQNIHR